MSQAYEIPEWDSSRNQIGGESLWQDKDGEWVSTVSKYVGKTYFHAGKGHLYRVVGVVFQAEDNRWEVLYRRVTHGGLLSGPLFSHRPEDFGRHGRFQEVKK